MRSKPDGEYKWILRIRDHFSKYCALYPLKQKTAKEVAAAVLQWLHYIVFTLVFGRVITVQNLKAPFLFYFVVIELKSLIAVPVTRNRKAL